MLTCGGGRAHLAYRYIAPGGGVGQPSQARAGTASNGKALQIEVSAAVRDVGVVDEMQQT
jgi:hypothetical protein